MDGYEADVLKSGEKLLSEGKVDLLIETHSKELEDECIGWLNERGYRCEVIDNAWWRFVVPEQRPTAHTQPVAVGRQTRYSRPLAWTKRVDGAISQRCDSVDYNMNS